jgi:membrane-associated phospholipid phosphatase
VIIGTDHASAAPGSRPGGNYPSGHIAVVTAIGFAVVLLYRELGHGWHRAAPAGAVTAAVLVAVSRIVLAEHWLLNAAGAVVPGPRIGLLVAAALRLVPAAPGTVRRVGPGRLPIIACRGSTCAASSW